MSASDVLAENTHTHVNKEVVEEIGFSLEK
jgi:hypothetical protein